MKMIKKHFTALLCTLCVLTFFSIVFSSCAEALNGDGSLAEDLAEQIGLGKEMINQKNHKGERSFAEGDYIEGAWHYGMLTEETSNPEVCDIWSFNVTAGETYCIFVWTDSMSEYSWSSTYLRYRLFESKTADFNEGIVLQGENEFLPPPRDYNEVENDNYTYGSYKTPYVFTAKSTQTLYIKFAGRHYKSQGETNYYFTGNYKLCVRKGRDGGNYIPLKFYGVPLIGWTSGELLFAKSNAWQDYVENKKVDWIDSYTYAFNAITGESYTFFADSKKNEDGTGGSGSFTASMDVSLYYEDSNGKYTSVIKEDYEYQGNDRYREGYPFTSPVTGKIYIDVYPTENKIENIGTYRIAVTSDNSVCELSLLYETPKYCYEPINSSIMAKGSVFNPAEDFKLTKYDDTTINLTNNDFVSYWGWGNLSENVKTIELFTYVDDEDQSASSNLLCTEADTQDSTSYVYVCYDEKRYYCYLKISDKRDSSLVFEIPEIENAFCVGNIVDIKLKISNEDKTNDESTKWYYSKTAQNSTLYEFTQKGEFLCKEEGDYYIFAGDSTNGFVFTKVTVFSAAENPYKITLNTGTEEILQTATYQLKNNNTVVDSVTWTLFDNSDGFCELDASAAKVSFYRAGKTFVLSATSSSVSGVKFAYTATVSDVQSYEITSELSSKLKEKYESVTSGVSMNSSLEAKSVVLTGGFSSQTYADIISYLSYIKNVNFSLDMSGATGITETWGSKTFSGMALTSVKLPEDLKALPEKAFYGCTKMTEITLPSALESIGLSAFYNCSLLGTITFPSSLKTISTNAFRNCTSLSSANFQDRTTWKAGTTVISVKNASTNATYLKTTYAYNTWNRSDTLTAYSYDSLYYKDYDDILLGTEERNYTFSVNANYIYVIRFAEKYDNDDTYSANAKYTVTCGNEVVPETNDTWSYFTTIYSVNNTATVKIKGNESSSGYVGVRIFGVSKNVSATSVTNIQNKPTGASLNQSTTVSLSKNTVTAYCFTAASNYNYYFMWSDSETKTNSSYIDGFALIFDPDYINAWQIDAKYETKLENSENGKYLILLQGADPTVSGTVNFNVYKESKN